MALPQACCVACCFRLLPAQTVSCVWSTVWHITSSLPCSYLAPSLSFKVLFLNMQRQRPASLWAYLCLWHSEAQNHQNFVWIQLHIISNPYKPCKTSLQKKKKFLLNVFFKFNSSSPLLTANFLNTPSCCAWCHLDQLKLVRGLRQSAATELQVCHVKSFCFWIASALSQTLSADSWGDQLAYKKTVHSLPVKLCILFACLNGCHMLRFAKLNRSRALKTLGRRKVGKKGTRL